MKSLYTILSILFFSSSLLHGQIIITEIMYNPPEAGQDTLEYIELFNASGVDIDLTGYYFSDGIEHSFSSGPTIYAGEYLVVSKSHSAMLNVFGVETHQWESGALNNKGEPIILNNPAGDIIASVKYSSDAPWPAEANGNGYSLELCDLNGSQSDPENWNYSNTPTGQVINGKGLYGSPTQANSSICSESADYIIVVKDFEFSPKDVTIAIGETILWNIASGTHNINGSQTDFPTNPESFRSGDPEEAPWTFSHTFDIAGKYLYQSDDYASEMRGTITVIEDMYPFHLIREVTSTDSEGVADSIGVKCSLTGIVSTPSFRDGDLTFVIQEDEEYGITVFGSRDLGYAASLGDEILIKGTIAQFNGLTEIEADSIFFISADNDHYGPVVSTTVNEDNENTLIEMEDVFLIDPSQWKMNGSFNVDISNGTESYEMRIYEHLGFKGKAAPEGVFSVIGAVGQFDNSKPYLEGYQLIPRGPEDIDPYEISTPEYPKYEIWEVTMNDSDGKPDSLGVKCRLEGIVIRENLRNRGYQFVMTDLNNDAGITVFSSEDIDGYIPESGDIIEIAGEITFYNGLTEIDAEEVKLISKGNDLPAPVNVNELGENTESRYTVLFPVQLKNLDVWPGDGSSFNVHIKATFSDNEYILRIDQNTELAQMLIDPTEEGWTNTIAITGVGTQFSNSVPYKDGYQIIPFTKDDIVGRGVSVEYAAEDLGISIFPNPVSSMLTMDSDVRVEQIDFFSMNGTKVKNVVVDNRNAQIDLSEFSSGTYFLVLKTEAGTAVTKIIKE